MREEFLQSVSAQESAVGQDSSLEQLSELMDFATHFIYHYHGTRRGQGRILRLLHTTGPTTQQDLQAQLNIQSSSVSEILTKLESSGLITRHRDERDKRRCIISITEAGVADLEAHNARRAERQKALYSGLSQEEQEELIRLLTRLCTTWESLLPYYEFHSDSSGTHTSLGGGTKKA